MTRNSMNAAGNGISKSLMAVVLVAVGSLGLMGCGSDMSTAPILSVSVQDEPGEVNRPTKDARLEAPFGFKAEKLGGNTVNLTWASPSEQGLTAIVQLDGQILAEVPATGGAYLDTMGKPAGSHTYDICFVKGFRSSRHSQAAIEISDPGGDTGGRIDDDFEDGR